MAKRLTPLHTLTVEQQDASAPAELAWVSASAGTGKTQVLTARVMRLLLHGIKPESILCLTFTKAGAAEMAQRIHERLAHWVRLKDPKLATELRALGEPFGADALAEARKLFASVLDARGGGLRIQTIHAFAQSVLAAFPIEAGMTPGFRALDEREEAQLAQKALSDMLVEADGACDAALIGDIQILSRRLGEYDAQGFLQRCGRAGEAMAGLGPPELIEDRLREAFGVPLGDIDTQMAKWVSDDLFEIEALKRVAAANAAWGTKTGLANADCIAAWLGASSANARIETLQELREVCATKAGDLRKFSPKLLDAEPHYAELAEGLDEAVGHLIGVRVKAEFAAFAAAALRAGQRFAAAYE
ncbi:MAG: UvrD-helicase domain-containing protein, partial [Sphingomonadaceae bacterium]|nr:UvrD-helicase domain-containing protein [Sphingomonadaceae bacterium]